MKAQDKKLLMVVGINPIDLYVGQRLRLRRNILRLSQDQLAARVGVTFQQVQKYETGVNRISASRLFDIAKALGVSITYFFEGVSSELDKLPGVPSGTGERSAGSFLAEEPAPFKDPMLNNQTLELVNAFWRIEDEDTRNKALALIKAMAGLS